MITLDTRRKPTFLTVLWSEHSYCNECREPKLVTAFHIRPIPNVFRLCRDCVAALLDETERSLENRRAFTYPDPEDPHKVLWQFDAPAQSEMPAFLRKIMD